MKLPMALAMIALLLLVSSVPAFTENITTILSKYSDFSNLNKLLSLTNVAAEINSRKSLTILAPDDSLLQPLVESSLPLEEVADILRYHVLLQYFSHDQLKSVTDGSTLITTLYQTTGKRDRNLGFVNFSVDKMTGTFGVGLPYPGAGLSGSIVKSVVEIPYSISVLQINNVLVPTDLGAPAPAPTTVNVSAIIESAGQYGTFLSLLAATRVDQLFQSRATTTGTGITIFAPTDKAFAALPAGVLNKLTAQQKIDILEYHALSAFYPLSALQQLSVPVTPTLATDANGAGRFTVNITNMQGTVTISTGLVNAPIMSTLYNSNPCSIFALGSVLLPEDVLGLPAPSPSPSLSPGASPSSLVPSNAVISAEAPSATEANQAPFLMTGWAVFVIALGLSSFSLL